MLVESVDARRRREGRAAHQAPEVDGTHAARRRRTGGAVGQLVARGRRRRPRGSTWSRARRRSPRGAWPAVKPPPRPTDRLGDPVAATASAVEHRQRADRAPAAARAGLRGRRCFHDGGHDDRLALVAPGRVRRRVRDRPASTASSPAGAAWSPTFGKIADPIADKALIGTALVGLSLLGDLPWWVTVVILVREVGVTAAAVLGDPARRHPGQPRRQAQDAAAGGRDRAVRAAADRLAARRCPRVVMAAAVAGHRRHRRRLRRQGAAAAPGRAAAGRLDRSGPRRDGSGGGR